MPAGPVPAGPVPTPGPAAPARVVAPAVPGPLPGPPSSRALGLALAVAVVLLLGATSLLVRLLLALRVLCPTDLTPALVEVLRSAPGATHVVRLAGAAVDPPGDVLLADLARALGVEGAGHGWSDAPELPDAVVVER